MDRKQKVDQLSMDGDMEHGLEDPRFGEMEAQESKRLEMLVPQEMLLWTRDVSARELTLMILEQLETEGVNVN